MICGCIYTIRHETGAMNRPLRLRNVRCYCLCASMFIPRTRNIYPRTPIMICGCIYTIRHETGAMNRTPTPTECMLQLFMYNQCLHHVHTIFIHVQPHLHPRAPTVGADLSCPHIMEHTLWIVHAHQCLFANALYTKVWLSCNLH